MMKSMIIASMASLLILTMMDIIHPVNQAQTPFAQDIVPNTDARVIAEQLKVVADADISYAKANGAEPPSYSSLTGLPPTLNTYGQMQIGSASTGLNGGTQTRFACVSQSIKPGSFHAYSTATALLPGVGFISGTGICGVQANSSPVWSSGKGSVAVTYWFTPYTATASSGTTSKTPIDVSACYQLTVYRNGSIRCNGVGSAPAWCSNQKNSKDRGHEKHGWLWFSCYLPSGSQCDFSSSPISCWTGG